LENNDRRVPNIGQFDAPQSSRRAKDLLTGADLPVQQIALQLGEESPGAWKYTE